MIKQEQVTKSSCHQKQTKIGVVFGVRTIINAKKNFITLKKLIENKRKHITQNNEKPKN